MLGAERGGTVLVAFSMALGEQCGDQRRDSEGLWHIYLDEDTAVIYDGDRRYPLINGEELLEQLLGPVAGAVTKKGRI